MVIGLRRAREIAGAEALTPWRGDALEPAFDISDDDACRAYIRASAGPYFHPVGTCRIGTDGLAVVDPCLRVRGTEGLRVADASVMPTIVSANTNATVLAIAEKAATLISPDERGLAVDARFGSSTRTDHVLRRCAGTGAGPGARAVSAQSTAQTKAGDPSRETGRRS